MEVVESFLEIDAPPDEVWGALRSFESYPEWNPVTRRIEGVIVERGGERRSRPPPERDGRTIEPAVVVIEPPRRLAWLDRFVVPFAFDRYREFHLEPIDDREGAAPEAPFDDPPRTRLLQRETVRGGLVPLAFDRDRVKRSFERMNRAVAARAERRANVTVRSTEGR